MRAVERLAAIRIPGSTSPDQRVPAEIVADQMREILASWGMPREHVAITVEAMLYADLRGIDSHGIGMLPAYHAWHAEGRLNIKPEIEVVLETPATALVDGGGGLGHVAGHTAMRLAIDKARSHGVGAVAAVR